MFPTFMNCLDSLGMVLEHGTWDVLVFDFWYKRLDTLQNGVLLAMLRDFPTKGFGRSDDEWTMQMSYRNVLPSPPWIVPPEIKT